MPVSPAAAPDLVFDLLEQQAARRSRRRVPACWWRVSEGVVWRWRKVLGVTRTDNEGSRRLIRTAAATGDDVVAGKVGISVP